MRMAGLQPGWAVVTNDGGRIGKIREVGQHYLVVKSTFSRPIYVPASAIANIEREVVHLNVAKGEVSAMGWQQPPREDDELQTRPESDLDRHI